MKLTSINFKLPAMIALFCLAVEGWTAASGYFAAKDALQSAAQDRLTLARETKGSQIRDAWSDYLRGNAELAGSRDVENALRAYLGAWNALNKMPGDQVKIALGKTTEADNGADYDLPTGIGAFKAAQDRFNPILQKMADQRDIDELYLLSAEGDVLYSTRLKDDFGTNLVDGPWSETPLGRLFDIMAETPFAVPSSYDFMVHEPAGEGFSGFVGTPIVATGNRRVGYLVSRISTLQIEALVNAPEGLGETGEIMIVGNDGVRRNRSRFGGAYEFPNMEFENKVLAVAGETGFATDWENANGEPVMVSYGPLMLGSLQWTVFAEASVDELMAPARALLVQLGIKLAITSILAIIVSILLARSVTQGLRKMRGMMKRIREGDYDTPVDTLARRDEIGSMAVSLEELRKGLKSGQDRAIEAARKGAAFQSVSSATMITDNDFMVLYQNDASKDLFIENIDAMREVWPDFDPENLVGTCIDQFHKTPEHQRAILNDPARLPFEADMTVGDTLRISLTVNAITDSHGEQVGFVLEWADVGVQRLNTGVIDAIRRNKILVEYAVDGRILNANEKFLESYGIAPEMIGETRFADLFPTEHSASAMWQRLQGGDFISEKTCRKSVNGRTLWMDTQLSPVLGTKGNVFKYVEISTDITKGEERKLRSEAQREEMEAAQKTVVTEIRRGLAALSEGDLTVSIDTYFSPDYEQLRHDFNETVSKLDETVFSLTGVSLSIQNGSTEISQAADDLSRRTENQAATLEETAAALEELTESVRSAAAGADKADGVVKEARESAQESGQVVLQAVTAMNQIETSSKQISQIIGVIDDIAFQTNLLALNAGVEAARAGEAGKGFAVVASEVRALAQRSSEAAKEIKTLIQESSRHVETGVDLVGEAGAALNRIVENVSNISDLVGNIAQSAREQATGIGEINTGVNQLDQVTQQNAAMVEESTAASHSMRMEADAMSKIISGFKTRKSAAQGQNVVPFSTPAGSLDAAPMFNPQDVAREAVNAPPPSASDESGWEDF